MILVHYSTVAAILALLPAISNLKLLEECAMLKIGMIGLTPHHGTNYKIATNYGQAHNRHPLISTNQNI